MPYSVARLRSTSSVQIPVSNTAWGCSVMMTMPSPPHSTAAPRASRLSAALAADYAAAPARREHARADDQHVDPAEGAHCRFERSSKLRLGGDVAAQPAEGRFVVQRGDRLVDVEAHHRRTAREQLFDAGLADAGGRAGDQGH